MKNGILISFTLAVILVTCGKSFGQSAGGMASSFNSGSALMLAAANGHEETVRLLLEKGADVDLKARYYNPLNNTYENLTAAEIAEKRGYTNIAKLIENSTFSPRAEENTQIYEQLREMSLDQLLSMSLNKPLSAQNASPVYTVKAGDTQRLIAARLHMPLSSLSAANPDVNWTALKGGQEINTPLANQTLKKSGTGNEMFISALTDRLIEAKNRELPAFITQSTVDQKIALVTTVEKRLADAQKQIVILNSRAEDAVRNGKNPEEYRTLAADVQAYMAVLAEMKSMLMQS
jgi:LysM repeat protein